MNETQCKTFPNLCKLKTVFTYLARDATEVMPAFRPVFDKNGTISETEFLWDTYITNSAAQYIRKAHTIQDIKKIPLVIYANLDTSITRPRNTSSHSFIVIVIDGRIYSFGVGMYLKNKNYFTSINSPDFTRILQASAEKNFIVKAITPLTPFFIGNFKRILQQYLPAVNLVITENNLEGILTNIEIRTNIPYSKYGENCSSFVTNMSNTDCSMGPSLRDILILGIHNPSSILSNIYNPAQLNQFIEALLREDNDFCMEWINRVHDILTGNSSTTSRRSSMSFMSKVIPSRFLPNYSFSGKSQKVGFGKHKSKRRNKTRRNK